MITERTPEECAQAQLDAYNARNIETFSEVYAEDVQLIDLASGEPFCIGRQALIERYGSMFADKTELHCRLVSRIVAAPWVIDEERVTGLRPDSEVHAIATYEVHNGFIQRAWFVREDS